jgi:aspartyl-tRNA synthetase
MLARTDHCGALRTKDVGREVVLCGWAASRRDHGGLIFVDLRDRSGVCQVTFRPEEVPEAHASARAVRNEFVLAVRGLVGLRGEENRNPKLPTGDVELIVREVEVLNTADPLPFAVEDDVEVGEEVRLKYRFLDLRRPAMLRTFEMRHRLALEARKALDGQGFLEVETPILTKSTPEGARDYLVPSRVHPGEFYALPQSPQLFKQLLMVSGFERYFQIARCFRDEDLRADRQPEFTQIDIEMSFVTAEEVYRAVEELVVRLAEVAGQPVVAPFPRLTWKEAMARYGIDKPDLRYGQPIVDISRPAAGSSFVPYAEALDQGGVVRALVVPSGAAFSRKRLDDLTEAAKGAGARGLVWMREGDQGMQSPALKTLGEEKARALFAAAGASRGDLLLTLAGPEMTASVALGALRQRLASEEGWGKGKGHAPLWVTEFPLFEWHEEDKRWYSSHHPFTAPNREAAISMESDPASAFAQAYDLVIDGFEIGSGSIRIHDKATQERIFRVLGIGEEEAEAKFGFLLRAFRLGAPPHGGIALGLDRLVAIFAGVDSLREVIAFPKTTSAADLMTGSPSPVSGRQLAEVSAMVRPRTIEELDRTLTELEAMRTVLASKALRDPGGRTS